jgi:hypothetical protein
MAFDVVYLLEAEQERDALPPGERSAVINADKKLRALGPKLLWPHSGTVKSVPEGRLRELRPRGGRSPWRALYTQVGEGFVIAALGPDGENDPRRFQQAVTRALDRLSKLEGDNENS